MRGSSRMVLRGRAAARGSIPLNSVEKYTHDFVPSAHLIVTVVNVYLVGVTLLYSWAIEYRVLR